MLMLQLLTEDEADPQAHTDDDSLGLLQSAFPHYSREDLEEMLTVCDGDVVSVFDSLTLTS